MTERMISIIWWIGLGSLIDYLWINHESLTIFAILLAIDFIFWVIDAFFNDKESLKSKLAIRWLVKKLATLSLPLIVVTILKWVWFQETEFFISAVMWILIIAEWYSIIWHIYSIKTNRQLPEIDAFEMLIERIVSLFNKILETFSSEK